jgi:acyl dehydratase
LYGESSSPIQFDHHYTSRTEFGMPLVDPTFTLTLATGPSVTDASQNDLAYLGWGEVGLPNPVFEGGPIYSRSEVLEKRE